MSDTPIEETPDVSTDQEVQPDATAPADPGAEADVQPEADAAVPDTTEAVAGIDPYDDPPAVVEVNPSEAAPGLAPSANHITCPECGATTAPDRWQYGKDALAVNRVVANKDGVLELGTPGFATIGGNEILICPVCTASTPFEEFGFTLH